MQTTLCYIEQDGKTLMLHRVKKKHDPNHDKWLGVGGKLESGETPQQCVIREVLEETGLTLTQYAYRGIVTFVSGDYRETMHLFTASAFTGTQKVCQEGNLCWVENERLLQLPMWAGDRVFFRLLAQGEPFFELMLIYDGENLIRALLRGQEIGIE